jgi:hypothetical protein
LRVHRRFNGVDQSIKPIEVEAAHYEGGHHFMQRELVTGILALVLSAGLAELPQ